MTADGPDVKQEITSGRNSQNNQAGRDVIHNYSAPPPVQSTIVKASNEQIAQFDPKTAQIIRIVRRLGLLILLSLMIGEMLLQSFWYADSGYVGSVIPLFTYMVLAVTAVLYVLLAVTLFERPINKLRAWILAFFKG